MHRRPGVMIAIIAALVMGLLPTTAHAVDPTPTSKNVVAAGSDGVDVYATPGTHRLNGRDWRTSCAPYSRTQRCTTDIWATQVTQEKGRFVSRTGWAFNNLTYLPSARTLWKENNLGRNANWTADGRVWRTECDTAATGRNGCRSYIRGQLVVSTKSSGVTRYAIKNDWIFNNIVQFSHPSNGGQPSAPVAPKPVTPNPVVPTTPVAPKPVPGTCTPTPLSGTKFGMTPDILHGLNLEQAWDKAHKLYGKPGMMRVFHSGAPNGWKAAAVAPGADLSVSFKIRPKDVLSGANDAKLRAWFQSAPKDVAIYWTYWHEPEDDIERGSFTAADYRAAWKHIHKIANEKCQPNLHSALILMGWTLDSPSGRNFADYYPGTAYIDVLSWDPYHPWTGTTYRDPQVVFGKVVAKSRAEGKPFAIAETGSILMGNDTGTGRAAWITAMASYLRQNGALYVSYFDTNEDGKEFRLMDKPSQEAWRNVIQG